MAGAYTYGVSSIPVPYFIDGEGCLAAYYPGSMSASVLQKGIDLILPQE